MRRMAVVFSAKMPVKWAPLAMHPRPEKKFAASMAESIGFEPKVAV